MNGTQESTSHVVKGPMIILSHREKNTQHTQKGPAGLGQITSQQEQQNSAVGNVRLQKGAKEWVEERKAHNQTKPSPIKGANHKERSVNNSRYKKSRMDGRICRQASRPWQTHKQQTSFERTQKWCTRKAQTSLACTQLIQEVVGHGLEVRKGMVWWWGERKAYSRVFTQALLGKMSCQDDILPKRRKDELEPLGACHEGQEEGTPTSWWIRIPR